MNTEKKGSTREYTGSEELDTTSTGFDYEIVETLENVELGVLSSNITTQMLERYSSVYVVKNSDFVLGIILFYKYKNFENFLDKSYKGKIMKFIREDLIETKQKLPEEEIEDQIYVIKQERIINTPLEIVLELYKRIELKKGYYIVVSDVRKLDKETYREICNDFKEFSPDKLLNYPIRREEVFLNKYRKLGEELDSSYCKKLFILTDKEITEYIDIFRKEITR